jgi:uncharacterized membrane protein
LIDEKLLNQAKRAGRHKTKRETVNAALSEYVQERTQMEILQIFGTIAYDPSYDYKAERRRMNFYR